MTFEDTVPAAMKPRHVAAVAAGNALEFYDFVTYAYFAVYIGRTFFPTQNPASSLLLSLATFGAGFLTRPIGAIVLGAYGDRAGRKPAMQLSFLLMGVCLIGIALVPSYARIGVAAPLLVILLRLLQGFALGGEVGPTTAYLIEASPPLKRGFYGSLQVGTQGVSILAAGVVGIVLGNLLTDQQVQDWGWRLAMLVGVIILPIGLMIRRSLPETHTAEDVARGRERTGAYVREIVLGLMLAASATIATYILNYMTTYALTTLHMKAGASFGVTALVGFVSVIAIVWCGHLSDRFGRKPVMLVTKGLLLLLIMPGFWIILDMHTTLAFYAVIGVLTALAQGSTAVAIVVVTESFPKSIRSGVLATVYAFAISIFGGSTQFILAWLQGLTNNPLVPAYYWLGATVVGVVAIVLVKETAPGKLR
jgi:MFS family permease